MRLISKGTYAFDQEGVLVIIPEDMDYVIPRQLELEWSPNMWQQGNFRPLRLVMNLTFVDLNNPKEIRLEFSSPIQIRVHYTPTEKFDALNRNALNSLAYWKDNQWILIPEVTDVNPILSRAWAGYLEFDIYSWGDPTIAMG
jgi:hypothetical protein